MRAPLCPAACARLRGAEVPGSCHMCEAREALHAPARPRLPWRNAIHLCAEIGNDRCIQWWWWRLPVASSPSGCLMYRKCELPLSTPARKEAQLRRCERTMSKPSSPTSGVAAAWHLMHSAPFMKPTVCGCSHEVHGALSVEACVELVLHLRGVRTVDGCTNIGAVWYSS